MAAKKAKSKKRLSGKSAERPKKFTAYLDAAVGCAEVIEAFGAQKIKYKLHLDYAQPYTHDDTWLPRVGRNKWVLLTTDDRMQYRGAEAAAIKRYRVRSFVFRSHMSGTGMASFLIKMMPAMRQFCGRHRAPFIGLLLPSEKIKLVMDEHGRVGPLKRIMT
jgi:hypothetical protein